VAPSNSFDYIGLFNTAMNCLDPVVFLEHHSLYKQKFPVPVDNLDYCIPFGKAKVVIRGEQVSVLTYASMTGRLVRLREELQRMGVSFELIDLRSLDFLSIDYETLGISLRKTGAIVIIEEAADGQGIAQRLVAEITQRFFDHLDAPPACLSSLAVPPSVSRVLEAAELLSDQQILAGVEDMAGRKWRSPTTDLGRR
jgi:2-oxoisovalerate dehydrogenase E1 component